MYCKYCSQRLSGNSIKKCPSCGAAINVYDYGQSFFEDHELDAWKDNTPFVSRTNTEMTTNDGAKMSIPTVQLSSAGMPATPKALNGAVGFFSKHKVSIIISSIAAVLVLVLSIVLVAVLVNKRNEDKGKDTVIDQQQTSGSSLGQEEGIKFFGVTNEISTFFLKNAKITVSVSETYENSEYIYTFEYNSKTYSIFINPDTNQLSYSKKDGTREYSNSRNLDFTLRIEKDTQKEIICITENSKDSFNEFISQICGVQIIEDQDSKADAAGTVATSQQDNMISLQQFLINKGFQRKGIQLWKYDDKTEQSALKVTLDKNETEYSFSYERNKVKGEIIHGSYPENHEWREDGDVYVSPEDAKAILQNIYSAKE